MRFAVVCTSSSHATKVAKIQVLEVLTHPKITLLSMGTVLDGNAVFPDDFEKLAEHADSGGTARGRHRFECPLCHRTEVIQHHILAPEVARLVAHGEKRISLTRIGAIVGRTTE